MRKFKNVFTKLVTLILSLFIVFSVTGCMDSGGGGGKIINPNGDVLTEDILYEDILKEDKLDEYKVNVARIVETKLNEDILLEDIQVEVYLADDIEGIFDDYFMYNGLAGQYDIDWFKVIGEFAVGTAVIVVTGVVSYFTAEVPGVGYVFATSCKEALKEAIIGAAVGSAINAGIGALVSGGNVDAVKKYAIEGAANGFMWGAISGALLGAFKGYTTYTNPNNVFVGNVQATKVDANGQLLSKSGQVIGYQGPNGYLFDTAGNVVGMIDDAGRMTSSITSLIPKTSQILSKTGKSVKYTINSSKQVLDTSNKVIGTINDAGQILNANGFVIGQVDDAGRLMSGVSKAVNAGLKIKPSGMIANATRVVEGTTQYLDDAGNVIGLLQRSSDGINYITMNVNPSSVRYIGELPAGGLSKVVAQVDDAGNLVSNWTKYFQAARSKGVALAWEQERALVMATGRGTRDWTMAEIEELINNGFVKGYQGHHINSAMYSPLLASEPNNIIFYSVAEHLSIGHGGNYQFITFGQLLSRIF